MITKSDPIKIIRITYRVYSVLIARNHGYTASNTLTFIEMFPLKPQRYITSFIIILQHDLRSSKARQRRTDLDDVEFDSRKSSWTLYRYGNYMQFAHTQCDTTNYDVGERQKELLVERKLYMKNSHCRSMHWLVKARVYTC